MAETARAIEVEGQLAQAYRWAAQDKLRLIINVRIAFLQGYIILSF